MTTPHRLFTMSFASVYPLDVAKAEVDVLIPWLTGYSLEELS